MRVLVYGAGAVGGFLAARLVATGSDVSVLARSSSAERLREKGISLADQGHTQTVRLPVFSSPEEAVATPSGYDLIILGMKSYDLAPALAPLVEMNLQNAILMGTQNGIGVEEVILQHFPDRGVVAAAVTMPISKLPTGALTVERSDRGLGLAAVTPSLVLEPWIELFRSNFSRVDVVRDYHSMKWSKAFLNIIGNATSAILNRPPGELYQDTRLFKMEMRMLEETLAVMDRRSIEVINLPGAPARWLARGMRLAPRIMLRQVLTRMVGSGRGEKMPSFHIDLMSGRGMTEVGFHNGAIAREGFTSGIATPVNAALNDTLVGLAQGQLDPTDFDGRPDRLLEIIDRYTLQQPVPAEEIRRS